MGEGPVIVAGHLEAIPCRMWHQVAKAGQHLVGQHTKNASKRSGGTGGHPIHRAGIGTGGRMRILLNLFPLCFYRTVLHD